MFDNKTDVTEKYKKEIEKYLYAKDRYLTTSDWLIVFVLCSHEFCLSDKKKEIAEIIITKLHPSQLVYFTLLEKEDITKYLRYASTIVSISSEIVMTIKTQ